MVILPLPLNNLVFIQFWTYRLNTYRFSSLLVKAPVLRPGPWLKRNGVLRRWSLGLDCTSLSLKHTLEADNGSLSSSFLCTFWVGAEWPCHPVLLCHRPESITSIWSWTRTPRAAGKTHLLGSSSCACSANGKWMNTKWSVPGELTKCSLYSCHPSEPQPTTKSSLVSQWDSLEGN